MKHDLDIPDVRQVALDNMILEMSLILKTLVKNPCSYFNYIVKNDEKCPNEMIVCSGVRFWNFIQGIKVASYIW